MKRNVLVLIAVVMGFSSGGHRRHHQRTSLGCCRTVGGLR